MRRVVLESPFAGSGPWPLRVLRRWANIRYARACVRDAVLRGEAPIANHLLFTQPGILRDDDPAERKEGIAAGLAWLPVADATVAYTDRGYSNGMRYGVAAARRAGIPVEFRTLRKQRAGGWLRRLGQALA